VLFRSLLAACGSKQQPYVPHPGAVDVADSKMYDALLYWNGSLNQAKEEFGRGRLPEGSKDLINKTGEAYDVMRGIWLTYRTAIKANNLSDAASAQADWDKQKANIDTLINDLVRLLLSHDIKPAPALTAEAWAGL